MIDITVLIENTTVSKELTPQHGLSLLIKSRESVILLDTGSDKSFILNAEKLQIDISSVSHLVLSHAHVDHTGGIKAFAEINKTAKIYLAGNPRDKFYFRIKKFIYIPIGISAPRIVFDRITSINTDTRITDDAWMIINTTHTGFRPSLNKYLYMKKDGKKLNDNFSHESTLVIKEGNELVLINSCSHTGVTNIIDSAVKAFPGHRIRSFVGGMHLCNPGGNVYEDVSIIEKFAEKLSGYNITYYTGHCTGEIPFEILQRILGKRLQRISTGMKLMV